MFSRNFITVSAVMIIGLASLSYAQSRTVRYVGVFLGDLSPMQAKLLNAPDGRGAVVGKVEDSSPAARAGLKVNDVIITFNSQPVVTRADFYRLLVTATPDSSRVTLGVIRNGETLNITVETAVRRATVAQQESAQINALAVSDVYARKDRAVEQDIKNKKQESSDKSEPVVSASSKDIGLTIMPMSSQLANYFKSEPGVLVQEVKDKSPAALAGIRAGDSIVAVDGKPILNITGYYQAINQLKGDGVDGSTRDETSMTIVRDGKQSIIQVKL